MTLAYVASSAVTCTLASLATSSTWTVGRQSGTIDNSSTLATDIFITGKISVGTTPTASTVIEVWLIPMLDDSNWPDTFGASDAGVTVTSRGHLLNYGIIVASIDVPAATSNVAYNFVRSMRSACGTVAIPKKSVLWVTHNTGVNFNSTGGNHLLSINPVTT